MLPVRLGCIWLAAHVHASGFEALPVLQGHSYDFCVNPHRRTICICITPLNYQAHHHQEYLHEMAAGAAALYVTKFLAVDSLYTFAGLAVHLTPRKQGLAGCLEVSELTPADKNALRSGFLSSLKALSTMLSLNADWLGNVWVSIE